MKKRVLFVSTLLAAVVFSISGCKHKPFPAPGLTTGGDYPDDVANVILTKCVNNFGCHDEAGYKANGGGLRMDTWSALLDGYPSGAAIVAYSPRFSPLLYAVNDGKLDSTLPTLAPLMPNNLPPLTQAEYNILKNWIMNGAQNKNGDIPFASNAATRQKTYITQQGCDLVAVVDNEKGVVMRYIDLALATGNIDKVPHAVHVSPDGAYAYVSFFAGNHMVKINTATDKVEGSIDLGAGSWNAFHISNDGSTIVVTNLTGGNVVVFDATTMSNAIAYPNYRNPHGVTTNDSFTTFYVTSQYGNCIYKIDRASNDSVQISIDGKALQFTSDSASVPDPHDIALSPDGNKLFITCQSSNEVRVIDAHTNKILKAIAVGKKPQELVVSKSKNQVYVTCMEGPEKTIGNVTLKGAVYEIDCNTLDASPLVSAADGAYLCQPHGVALDEYLKNQLIIPSRNISSTGPAPHHTSNCGGRNGHYHFFDLGNKSILTRKFEATPDPYGAEVRFK